MELWQVFQELLNSKGVKVADVAKATKIPYTTVDSIIKKKLKDIKYSNAEKIAAYLGVSTDYLASGGNVDPAKNASKSPMLEKVIAAISNDPELLSYVNEVVNREDLRLIIQHTKGEELSPKAVIQMFKIMKALEEGKGEPGDGLD